jgi:hypothetical protein
MNEEIIRVLEMVKGEKITPEEGEKLISAITGTDSNAIKKSKYSMLRVRVDVRDPEKSEKAKVNVNVPLSVAKKAAGLMHLIPIDAKKELADKGIDLESFDLAELIEMFEDGEINEELVNVVAGDEEKGATVRVYVD